MLLSLQGDLEFTCEQPERQRNGIEIADGDATVSYDIRGMPGMGMTQARATKAAETDL